MPFKDFDLDRPEVSTLVARQGDLEVHLTTWQDLPELDALRKANRDWLAEWTVRSVAKRNTGSLTFAVKRGGRAVGELVLWNTDREHTLVSPSLSYWVDQAHARQGIMGFAVRAVLHHATTTLRLEQVLVPIALENEASLALAESLQLRRMGEAKYDAAHAKHMVYAAERNNDANL